MKIVRFRTTLFAIAMITGFAASSLADESKTEDASRTHLRAHAGVDVARRLLHSADPEEQLRGIERAASIATPQAVWLLAQTATTTSGQATPRALIALARALSRFADYESARTALFAIVSNKHALDRSSATDDRLVELARQTAALAIAQSGVDRALKQLYDVAKVAGAGQNAAILALRAVPPHASEFVGNLHEPSLLPTPAATMLATPAADPELAYDRAWALARSPAPNAGVLIAAMVKKPLHDEGALGLRAYIVRALARGDRNPSIDRMLARLAHSADGQARAIGTFASIALFHASLESALDDSDARVRRAAIMGSFALPPSRSLEHALLARSITETDSITRQLLAVGLLGGDPDRVLTTHSLALRAQSGGADMALAAYALARRANEPFERSIQALLTSNDPVLRAHTARGLGMSPLPDASGRLATAYAYETDASVRRAIVAALKERTMDASSPSRKATLEMAARLDPDGPTRQAAQRALKHGPSADHEGPPTAGEVAWLRIANGNGTRPDSVYVGAVVRGDGFAVPIAFDSDGFAIVSGLLPGDSRLVLATRLPSGEGEVR